MHLQIFFYSFFIWAIKSSRLSSVSSTVAPLAALCFKQEKVLSAFSWLPLNYHLSPFKPFCVTEYWPQLEWCKLQWCLLGGQACCRMLLVTLCQSPLTLVQYLRNTIVCVYAHKLICCTMTNPSKLLQIWQLAKVIVCCSPHSLSSCMTSSSSSTTSTFGRSASFFWKEKFTQTVLQYCIKPLYTCSLSLKWSDTKRNDQFHP